MLNILVPALLLFAHQGVKVPPGGWKISGVIVDGKGSPLPNAEMARYFLLQGGKYFPVEGLKADGQGHFEGPIKPYKLPMTYMVLSQNRDLGTCAVFTEESVKAPLRIVLKPLAEVSFKPAFESGYEPVNMATSLTCPGTNLILSYEPGPYRIPEGSYELGFVSQEFDRNKRPFTVRAGEKIDLGSVPVPLSPISRNIGKPAMPLVVAEVRGLPSGFKLSDLKGKWVLMEFWGYW